MHANVPLRAVDGLQVLVVGSDQIHASVPGGPRLECGPHGLAILATFHTPRTVQDALDRISPHLPSSMATAEVLTAIVRLHKAHLLRPPGDDEETPRTARGFGAAPIHIAMLNDRTRTDAFLRAIRKAVSPGDVVIDLGTGTGVLAIAAAQAGARRVYAIEASGIADVAAAMFEAGGVGDRISLVRGWSTGAVFEERASMIGTS